MTYKTLDDLECFCGRLLAEQVARDYVAVERLHVQRVREAIDLTADDFTEQDEP